MEFITAQELKARWINEDIPTDEQINFLLEDSVDTLFNYVPNLEALISDGITTLATVKRIQMSMIQRYFSTNGEYRTSYSESVGSFSTSGSFSSGNKWTTGLMTLLPEELSLLTGANGRTKNRVMSAERVGASRFSAGRAETNSFWNMREKIDVSGNSWVYKR